jgi:D-threo-aldose 1-dehydrogenase
MGVAVIKDALLGQSAVAVTPLGLGCAPLANLYVEVDDDQATATVDEAWAAGVRYFDTAPHYGLGLSERRLGAALRDRPREDYAVSTKVGRLLVPDPAGAGRRDEAFNVPATYRREWDFTADGVRRSLEESLRRLGLDRVDFLLIHDPEDHADIALEEGYPALRELRDQGVVGAIGVGSMNWQVLHRFVTEVELDAVMLAGRYTLLEQPALDALLPDCLDRGVSVLNVGVFNSGLLAVEEPREDLHYEYRTVPPEVLARARAIAALCAAHHTVLPAAALAFASAHPAVAAVVVGAESPAQIRRNAELFAAAPPPADLWSDLVDAGLLRPDAPVPGGLS